MAISLTLSPQEQTTCLVNSSLAAFSAHCLYGPQVALISALSTAGLYLLNSKRNTHCWFSPSRFHKLTETIKNELPFMLTCSIAMGFFGSLFMHKPIQAPMQWLLSSTSLYDRARKVFFICIRAPIVEEIFFRGVILDGLRNVQMFVIGKANSSFATISRIALQAMVFARAHISTLHTKIQNVVICSLIFFVGYLLGEYKEEDQSLWGSTGLHFSINCSATTRGLLFGI